MTADSALITVADYENECRRILPASMFRALYGDFGAAEWTTNDNNLNAFHARKLRPRVLVDVSERRMSTVVLGEPISLPVVIAPTGHHQRNNHEGELASARAAGRAGTILTVSTSSSYSIEEVAAVATGPLWFQVYVFRDRSLVENLVRRAESAGYCGLLVTVDNPGLGSREREAKYRQQGYSIDDEVEFAPFLEAERTLRNFRGIGRDDVPTQATFNDSLDPTLSWKHIDWLRSITTMPIVIKGIQSGEDVAACLEHNVAGVVVSNHGGHAMPDARATLDVLEEVATIAGSLEIYLDGGVRTGSDVLKALALGATAVMLGRAPLFGLTVGGEDGVVGVLETIRRELDDAMNYCGVPDVQAVPRSLVT